MKKRLLAIILIMGMALTALAAPAAAVNAPERLEAGAPTGAVTYQEGEKAHEVYFNKKSMTLTIPSAGTGTLIFTLDGSWPGDETLHFQYDNNVISWALKGTEVNYGSNELTITTNRQEKQTLQLLLQAKRVVTF